ncbi:MAG TPA: acetate--CoA ligase family protein, partial [Thiohalobacter sp.]|nr:acetate--CoA ligase family protein [Thiohalobacter sp.]
MSAHALESLFNPRGVAVFGASERPGALGTTVLANLIEAGFKGAVIPVNPRHDSVQGLPCRSDLSGRDQPVDLAVIVTPAATVPGILRQCGEAGVRGAVILSAGFGEKDPGGRRLRQEIIEIAADAGIRLMGPNCLGLIRPSIGLNATFSLNQALPGNLALVSQSGAMITAVLDWASNRGIGFSAVASTGDAADLGFGDVLDYLAVDPKTEGILLYIEGIGDARRFLTGLRAAARMKPVIVLKSARRSSGARAAATHTGAMIGGDDVFDAALARAGVVRVERISQWFAAARTLSSGIELRGEKLLLLTNGGGPGVMAADRATDLGLSLPELDRGTIAALDQVLPAQWSRENPVDILGDATPTRYGDAIELCLADPGVDMLIVMLTPQAMTDPSGCAREIIRRVQGREGAAKPVVACWLGEAMVAEARALFDQAGIPNFTSPEAAVEALSYRVAHRRNQQLLLQVPPAVMELAPPDIEGARLILDAVRQSGRTILTAREAKAVLHAFHIPTTQAVLARDADEAMIAAQGLGFPVAIKVSAAELSHKTDVGGVKLNLNSAQAVREQSRDMLDRLRQQHPEVEIEGITVERMAEVGQARELLVGVDRDPVFGPVIAFGMGGTTVEVIRDRALALPPLNAMLSAQLIDQTRAARLLGAFRSAPPAQREALEQVLLRVSE